MAARDFSTPMAAAAPKHETAAPGLAQPRSRLARPTELERVYDPTEYAMVAALRVVLDLPRQLPDRGQGGVR